MNPAKLAKELEGQCALPAMRPVVIGFDAFVDEVIDVVGTRTSTESYVPLPTIEDFGAWASASAGRSGLREFVTLERTAGGCSVNSGDALAALGFTVDAFAGVGVPQEKVFNKFSSKCRSVNPLGMEPGRAMVYEFQDGKLILCSFSHFSQFTPEHLERTLVEGSYHIACKSAAAIALTSWSVYPHMTECWKYLQDEVYSRLTHKPRFFLDLADPASRSPSDLLGMISALAGFEKIGPVTLSLNGNEANQIAKALGLSAATNDPYDLERLAVEIRERAQISELGIHTIRFATGATAGGVATVASPYCPNPRKSVGAGDRFNAGWLAGSLLDLEAKESLLLGVASAGFFVRAARSGSFQEIQKFLQLWASDSLEESTLI